jgi:hypothetical protein
MQASAMWNEAPAVTRSVVISNAAMSLLITVAPALGPHFSLSLTGASHGYVAPLVTSFLGGSLGSNPVMSFLMLLFGAMMAFSYFTTLEREYGSLRFLAWLCVCNIAIGLPFLLLSLVLSFIHPSLGMSACNGLWPLLLVALTQQCLADPSRTMSIWGLFQLPGKWYPFGLVAFFSLLSMQIQLTLCVAVLVGVAVTVDQGGEPPVAWMGKLRLPLDRHLPSMEVALWVEQGADTGHSLSGKTPLPARIVGTIGQLLFVLGSASPAVLKQCYIPAGSSMPKTISTGSSFNRGLEQQSSSFQAFQGHGHRLGADNEI